MLKHDIFWTYFQLRRSRLIKTKESELAVLLVDSHVLEKGLTMPNRRLGFGQQRVRNLVKVSSINSIYPLVSDSRTL